MKTSLKATVLVIITSVLGSDLTADSDEPPQQAQPAAIIQRAISTFPENPLRIDGTMMIINRKGFISHKYGFNATIDINGDKPFAKYTFFVPESKTFMHLYTAVHQDGTVKTIFRKGKSDVSPAPPLDSPILGSDITWENLSLQFLTWTNTTFIGKDTVLGINTSVINLYPGKYTDTSHYRVWIADKTGALLRFEERTADDELKRTVWIKSLKKINNSFTIKDLEAEALPVKHRTKIKIHSISEVIE